MPTGFPTVWLALRGSRRHLGYMVSDSTPSASDVSQPSDLTGKILIAMPGMGDPRFDKSVIYLCAHSAEGAMGLIVNKPAPEVKLEDLLAQLDVSLTPQARDTPVHFGGPVEHGRGFVLHSDDYAGNESTLKVSGGLGLTATLDVLEDIGSGAGPAQAILALGYSGWGPGQLEAEITQNGWLTCDGAPEIVFGSDNEAKWQAALGTLGVSALLLSSEAGHA